MRLIAILLAAALLPAAEPGMVLVPRGRFGMGRHKLTSDDKTKMRPQILLDDRPVHSVTVSAFLLDSHEVTQAEYARFAAATKRATPYHWVHGKVPPGTERFPAYNVTWHDAVAYCASLGKRLPTEAEWERAARGGIEGAEYPWGDQADTKAARFNTETGPGEVGRYAPNGFGLYDMAGSVAEWTADWFSRDYYSKSEATDPKGPETGAYRIIRGGGWPDPAKRITVYFRNWVRPTQRQPNIGFRCAKAAPPAEARISERLAGFAGTVSFYAKNLNTGEEFSRDADTPVRTASTIKLPIFAAVHQAVADGKASWDEEIAVPAEEISGGSGILKDLTPGRKYPLRDLAALMIVLSDNTATNLILNRVTADQVNEFLEANGYTKTRALRKILRGNTASGWSKAGKDKANAPFGIGVSTPREMGRMLEQISRGTLVNAEASRAMREVLERQQDKDGIGRRLSGYRVASKSGALDALRSDVALVTADGEAYAIAISVDKLPKTDYTADNAGKELIAEIAPLLIEKLQRKPE